MAAHAILAIIAVIAAVGLGATAATGLFATSTVGNMDLGALVPGQIGNATTTTMVHVTNNTTYKIGVDHRDRIGSVFSIFTVTVSVNGSNYNVTNEPSNTHITLSNGTYSFSVKLFYEVRNKVHTANETNVPFLFLHPAEMEYENETVDHEFENETRDNSTPDSSLNGTPVASAEHSGNYSNEGQNDNEQGNNVQGDNGTNGVALATLTFHVNGSAGDYNENEATDSARSIPLTINL